MKSHDFNDLLLSLQSNMLNFAFILTSSPRSAYTLLQQATLQALDNCEDYEGSESQFKDWVFGIMRSMADEMPRHEKAYVPRLDIAKAVGFDGDVPEGSVSVDDLNSVLATFEPERREIISMHLCGYTSVEISRSKGLTIHLVRTTLVHDWHRLAARLSLL